MRRAPQFALFILLCLGSLLGCEVFFPPLPQPTPSPTAQTEQRAGASRSIPQNDTWVGLSHTGDGAVYTIAVSGNDVFAGGVRKNSSSV
jgi:hypothetical protein